MAQAAVNVVFTAVMAAIWCFFLALFEGLKPAAAFLSGYAMEWALSVDNLMAIALVFAYFRLPKRYEPRILSAGIASAVVFRLLFTLVGASLFATWERPCELIFGFVVACTAVKMIMNEGEDSAEMVDHNSRWYVRYLRRWFPITSDVSAPVFFKEKVDNPRTGQASWYATPLLACLVAVEATDIVFSFDSVPTVVSVSRTPLVIYSAMLFAILGLRSMYFLLSAAQKYLALLPRAVVGILFFVSFKMLIHGLIGLDLGGFTLPVVVGLLAWGIVASLKEEKNGRPQEEI